MNHTISPSRIQVGGGGITPKRAATYYSARYSQKCMKMRKIGPIFGRIQNVLCVDPLNLSIDGFRQPPSIGLTIHLHYIGFPLGKGWGLYVVEGPLRCISLTLLLQVSARILSSKPVLLVCREGKNRPSRGAQDFLKNSMTEKTFRTCGGAYSLKPRTFFHLV